MATLSPGSHLGRYEIKEPIGRGGMALVFRAYDPLLGREVAIKVLSAFFPGDPTFPERFAQEARTIARLNHPNILQIYDYGEDQGFIYIVSELLEGGTLQDKLGGPMPLEDAFKVSRPLNLQEAFKILRPLSEALDHAHANGIVHRDIKPSNVLMDSDSVPRLADFGLSRVMEQVYRMTSPHEAIGTPEYMSPEQAMGEDTDYRSDLYSFGILMYQILVGRTPFRADTVAATLMAHVHRELTFPADRNDVLSDDVKAVLFKAAAKNPDDRFESASRMVDALAEAFEYSAEATQRVFMPTVVAPAVPVDVVASVEDETPSGTTRRKSSRKGLLFSISGLAVVTVAVMLVIVFMTRPDDNSGLGENIDTPTQTAQTPLPVTGPSDTLTAVPVAALSGETPVPASPDLTLPNTLATASAIEGLMLGVRAKVHELRGLYPSETIDTWFIGRQQLGDLANTFFRRGELRDQVFETEELFKALDLLDQDDDLEQITRDLLLHDVFAVFDDQSRRLYISTDSSGIGPVEELAYASVYMAGLQEQLFGVSDLRGKARRSNFDEFRAVTAFTSGEVFQIREGYSFEQFGGQTAVNVSTVPDQSVLNNVPFIVGSTVTFPEYEGGSFVAYMYATSGNWDAVNEVYNNPPVSTEQIIHPQKYLDGELPIETELTDVRSELGIGWSRLSTNRMGEFILRTWLEQQLDFETASTAAAGWGGDQYTLLLGPGGESVFVLLVNWDTEDDAREFFDAYREFADSSTMDTLVSRRTGEAQHWWITPDKTWFIQDKGSSTYLILADDEPLVRQVFSFLPAS